MILYYIQGCCNNYLSKKRENWYCKSCGDTYGVLFEIDTKKKDWIEDMFKHYGELQCLPIVFKPINLPTEELERMKSNILEYIQETYID